jgi:hypothetical protein
LASTGKKTTMAKLAREARLRERRLEKQARKVARKHAAAQDHGSPDELPTVFGESGDGEPEGAEPAPDDGSARDSPSL